MSPEERHLKLRLQPRPKRGGVEELRKISDPVEFAIATADYLGIQPISLPPGFTPPTDLLCGMPYEAWGRVKALPLCRTNGRLTVAFADPFDLPAQEEVARWGHGKIWTLVVPRNEFAEIFQRLKQAEEA